MAIYHLTVKTISKGGNSSSLSRYDYIERIEKYAYDSNEVMSCAYGNMPEWAQENDREYWKSADSHERQNGRLCKQIEFAIPKELSPGAQIDLAVNFVESIASTKDGPLPYSLVVHRGKGTNPHCHALISERVNDGLARTPETWFKRTGKTPEAGGARKTEALKPREWLCSIREEWSRQANQALERAGHGERIDHRTLAQQGIDREPTYHLGPMLTRMERAGKITRIGKINRHIRDIEKLKNQRAVLEDLSREEKPRIKTEKALKSPVQSRPAPAVPARGLEARIKQLSDEDHADLEDIKVKFWERQKRTGGGDWKKCINFVEQYGIHGITLAEISKVKLGYNDFIKEEQKKCDEAWRKLDIARKNLDKYENDNFKIVKIFSKKGIELKLEIDIEQKKYNIAKTELENKELCKHYVEKMQLAFFESEDYKKYKERKDVRYKELNELKKVKSLFSELVRAQVTGYTAQKKMTDELIKQWERAKPEQQEEIVKNAEKTVAHFKALSKSREGDIER